MTDLVVAAMGVCPVPRSPVILRCRSRSSRVSCTVSEELVNTFESTDGRGAWVLALGPSRRSVSHCGCRESLPARPGALTSSLVSCKSSSTRCRPLQHGATPRGIARDPSSRPRPSSVETDERGPPSSATAWDGSGHARPRRSHGRSLVDIAPGRLLDLGSPTPRAGSGSIDWPARDGDC